MEKKTAKELYDALSTESKDGIIATCNDLLHGNGLSAEDTMQVFRYAVLTLKPQGDN